MINWEELKHIHVIRKLEEIVSHWFQVDIFYVDESGSLKNFDALDRKPNFSNPLSTLLFSREKSRNEIAKFFRIVNEQVYRDKKTTFVSEGMGGVGKVVAVPINLDGEYLGAVIAYSFEDEDFVPESVASRLNWSEEFGLDKRILDQALVSLRRISSSEYRYFTQLVELVSQEIVTFHSEISRRDKRISELSNQLEERFSYQSMIGKSKAMQELYSLLDKVSQSDSTVLIQGENGTGKELIARAVHFGSSRKEAQFISVNCSAFNENLLDSELFGHVRGAFTGAIKDKKGLFESADRGTLLLDEIGDMSLSMQVKLLRVLQEGTFMPVGGTEQRKVNVRVLAATNRDLKGMIEKGTFREDLYYRVNVINIAVPALRDRKEDIGILLDSFLSRGCKSKGLPMKMFTKRALEKIYDYNWPGNVRELENEVERCIVLSAAETKINVELLSSRIREFGENAKMQGVRMAGKLKDALEELEKTMIREGLKRTNWNKSRLAKELGISRAGLIMKVEKYGLDKRRLLRSAGGEGNVA